MSLCKLSPLKERRPELNLESHLGNKAPGGRDMLHRNVALRAMLRNMPLRLGDEPRTKKGQAGSLTILVKNLDVKGSSGYFLFVAMCSMCGIYTHVGIFVL